MDKIKYAVFPVAGLGTRFLPATKIVPKEMFPISDKPLIAYAVEEAYSAGIKQMIFITNSKKQSIESYFNSTCEMEPGFNRTKSNNTVDLLNSITPSDMNCIFVNQEHPLGLGHAVLCAREYIGDNSFAVLLCDDFLVSHPSVTKQMVEQYKNYQTSILAVRNVDIEDTRKYGIVDSDDLDNQVIDIKKIVEKPLPKDAPSTLSVTGRYIFTPEIFDEISKLHAGVGEEIQLTDAIESMIKINTVLAYRYNGQCYDCGSKLGYMQAIVEMGLNDREVSDSFSKWLKSKNKSS